MKYKQVLFPFTFALALSCTVLLSGCDNKANDESLKLSTINGKVFDTQALNYTIKTTLPARVIASQIAEIRPQVGGIILKREFEESSDVKEGQSLYRIDPAIYQANYDSALASVASAEASAKIAELTVNRYKDLVKTKSISQQEYDKAVADALQANAAVLVAKANLNTAKVNLDYTKVYSPIDGYIGKSNVTEGALVSAGQSTAMATVQKIDPIYIDMTQAASVFEKNEKEKGSLYTPDEKVEIYFNDGSKYPFDGHMIFSDKNVNQTTGTVTLRAEFPNPDTQILPGMFLKPQLTLGYIKNAILVPQKGITSNQAGNYTTIVALPVPKDKEVEYLAPALVAKILTTPNPTEQEIKAAEEKAKVNAERIIKARNDDKQITDKTFYYLERRDDVKVYAGISGYWIVTGGINAGEKIVVTGLLNVPGTNINDPKNRTFINIVGEPQSLSQEQLDDMIEHNIK